MSMSQTFRQSWDRLDNIPLAIEEDNQILMSKIEDGEVGQVC